MAHIKTLVPLVPKSDGRTIKVEPKRADPFYHSEQHKLWRDQVLRNAGYRCEWVENGQRCIKAAPHNRMFADHIRERLDGCDPLDTANGQCLCGAHHTLKTAQARAHRSRLGGGG